MVRNLLCRLFLMGTDFDQALTLCLPDPVDGTASELLATRKIKQAVLEAGRPQICDKDFHGFLPSVFHSINSVSVLRHPFT